MRFKEKPVKVRKKPVVVDAQQFNKADRSTWHPEIREGGIIWLQGELVKIPPFWVPTLEGFHEVSDGDWIITGVKGETYPCKPDAFALTYEVVP